MKTKIIMDACINHNGNIETAKRLIEQAKENGADFIKFQLHIPDKEMLSHVPQSSNFDEPLYDLLKRIALSKDQHRILKNYCDDIGIRYLCTPFCTEAVDILESLGVNSYKVGSGEMTNLPLLNKIAKTGKPIIISTGMSRPGEIDETVVYLKSMNAIFTLMNCTSIYPTPCDKTRINLIPILREKYRVPVGHSDHTTSIYTSLGAVALGATIIEKHFTLDRNQDGPDHKVSIEPHELKELVKGIRCIEQAKKGEFGVYEEEEEIRKWARESIVTKETIQPGEEFNTHNITTKRPGLGDDLSTVPAEDYYQLIGKRAARTIEKNRIIRWDDIE